MSKKPKVNVLPIEQGATPDPQNANKHTARGGALLENSLQRRGAFRSIASAGKGVDVPVVYAGNYTLEKAAAAGFKEIVNVHVTGDQLVNVVRDDIAPHTAEAIALGLEDNEIGKASYNPDLDILAAVMADPAMQTLKAEDKILAGIVGDMNLRAGNLFLDMDNTDEKHPRPKQNNNVYSLTIPFSKDERDKALFILNQVKKEKNFPTSTEAFIFILEAYADS